MIEELKAKREISRLRWLERIKYASNFGNAAVDTTGNAFWHVLDSDCIGGATPNLERAEKVRRISEECLGFWDSAIQAVSHQSAIKDMQRAASIAGADDQQEQEAIALLVIDSIRVTHQSISKDGTLDTTITLTNRDGEEVVGYLLHKWDGAWVPYKDMLYRWISTPVLGIAHSLPGPFETLCIKALDVAARTQAKTVPPEAAPQYYVCNDAGQFFVDWTMPEWASLPVASFTDDETCAAVFSSPEHAMVELSEYVDVPDYPGGLRIVKKDSR